MIFSTQLEAVPPAADRLCRQRQFEVAQAKAGKLTNRTRPRDLSRPRSRLASASSRNHTLHSSPFVQPSPVLADLSTSVSDYALTSSSMCVGHVVARYGGMENGLRLVGRGSKRVGMSMWICGVNRHAV